MAVPSGRLSHLGDSSVRKSAMPKLTGTAISSAIADVISVPRIITRPPKRFCTGSHSLCQRNERPYSLIAGAAPMNSETMMPAISASVSHAAAWASNENRTSGSELARRCAGGWLRGSARFMVCSSG